MAEIIIIELTSAIKEAYPYQSSIYTVFATNAVLMVMAIVIFIASAEL